MPPAAALKIIDDVDAAAAVLDPLRLELLTALDEPDSAAGLARRLGMPRQKINYHLRALTARGLVEEVGERQKRGCVERLVRAVARGYVIDPGTLGAVATDPSRVRDQMSSAYLVAVAATVIREVALQQRRAEDEHKRLPTLTVQTEVRFSSAQRQQEFASELAAEIARLVEKYHDAESPVGKRFRLVAASYPAPAASNESPAA